MRETITYIVENEEKSEPLYTDGRILKSYRNFGIIWESLKIFIHRASIYPSNVCYQ